MTLNFSVKNLSATRNFSFLFKNSSARPCLCLLAAVQGLESNQNVWNILRSPGPGSLHQRHDLIDFRFGFWLFLILTFLHSTIFRGETSRSTVMTRSRRSWEGEGRGKLEEEEEEEVVVVVELVEVVMVEVDVVEE